jgi:hypothetical protein
MVPQSCSKGTEGIWTLSFTLSTASEITKLGLGLCYGLNIYLKVCVRTADNKTTVSGDGAAWEVITSRGLCYPRRELALSSFHMSWCNTSTLTSCRTINPGLPSFQNYKKINFSLQITHSQVYYYSNKIRQGAQKDLFRNKKGWNTKFWRSKEL